MVLTTMVDDDHDACHVMTMTMLIMMLLMTVTMFITGRFAHSGDRYGKARSFPNTVVPPGFDPDPDPQ